MSRTSVVILTVYMLLMITLISGLFSTRSRVLGRQDAAASKAAWEQWRQEAKRQADGTGPVERRPPTATEAPTLLLLRDHFGTCLTLTLVISTVLFATLAFMVRGVLSGPKLRIHQDTGHRPVT